MYTRKINLKELILELDCLDEATVEALENTETGIESYGVEYSVTRKGGDDYEVLPTPYELMKQCAAVSHDVIIDTNTELSPAQFSTICKGMLSDAEWWEGENRDMLIGFSEDRFEG